MKKISSRMVHGDARPQDGALLKSVADQIPGRTICAFGEACSWPTQSFITKFKDEFDSYSEVKKTLPADRRVLV
jgi:NADH-quinone oxidoreductase subunit F